MYDPDPPSPALRIVSSTTSTERLAYTANWLHAEHQAQLAQADPIAVRYSAEQPTAQTDKQFLAIRDQLGVSPEVLGGILGNWLSVTKASGRDALVFRASGAVERLKALRIADADLSGALDAAL